MFHVKQIYRNLWGVSRETNFVPKLEDCKQWQFSRAFSNKSSIRTLASTSQCRWLKALVRTKMAQSLQQTPKRTRKCSKCSTEMPSNRFFVVVKPCLRKKTIRQEGQRAPTKKIPMVQIWFPANARLTTIFAN